MSDVAAWIAGVIGFIALLFVGLLLGGVLQVGGAEIQGEADRLSNSGREKSIVFDPNRTLNTYEGFYNKCNLYNATVLDAEAAEEEVAAREKTYDAESDDFGTEKKAINGLRENARGLTNQARDIASQYNADSSASTRAPFKAAELPYQLDPRGAELAQCGSPKEGER
jgi:hypothetical protein